MPSVLIVLLSIATVAASALAPLKYSAPIHGFLIKLLRTLVLAVVALPFEVIRIQVVLRRHLLSSLLKYIAISPRVLGP